MRNKRIFVITLSVMIAVALTACVAIPLTSREEPREEVTDSTPAAVTEDRLNILITGSDRTSGLTDVIILLSLDRTNNSAAVLQIPRDTYASYTDKSYKKLNGAYGRLGAEGLCSFVSESLGVAVDKYLMLSPDAFVGAVDALGGVEVTLKEPMRYSDPEQGLFIALDSGRQILNGKRAEQFIRYRSGYSDGDLGRMDAQKQFLCGLLTAARKKNDPFTLAKLAATLLGKTETNITPAEGAAIAGEMMALNTENIFLITAPGEAVVAKESGASYYSLSGKAMGEVLERYFGGSAAGFDKNGVFLNRKYSGFLSVYEGYSEYKVYSAKNILEGK